MDIPSGTGPSARTTIAVGGGKGGVGKSTVSLNLALALAAAGARVGLLDADLSGPDLPRMLNLKRTESQRHWTLARAGGSRMEPIEVHGLKVMSTGFVVGEDAPFALPAVMTQRVVWQLVHETDWGEIDHLIVDLPPGTADIPQQLMGSPLWRADRDPAARLGRALDLG